MVITMGIGTIVALAAATLMAFSAEQFFAIMEKNIAEESLLTGTFLFRSYLGQAVDVRGVDRTAMSAAAGVCSQGYGCPDVTGFTFGPSEPQSSNGNGRVVSVYDSAFTNAATTVALQTAANLRTPADFDGGVDRLAAFYRETAPPGSSSNAAANGSFKPTAIWFERPNLVGTEGRWGRLIFKSGTQGRALTAGGWIGPSDADVTGAGDVLNPDQGDLLVDRITRVQITTNQGTTTTPDYQARVRSVTLVLTARYFRGINRATWRWCPDRSRDNFPAAPPPVGERIMFATDGVPITQCERSPSDVYRDIQQTVVIALRNNIISLASSGGAQLPERAYGFIYFYRPLLPIVNF